MPRFNDIDVEVDNFMKYVFESSDRLQGFNEKKLYKTILELNERKEIIAWKKELNPSQPKLNFFDIRKTSKDYVAKELKWYLSEDLDVSSIEKHARIWSQVKSTKNKINSNYGWCIFSEENFNQYSECLFKLILDANTRQATMIYTRPSMYIDATKDDMKDFMCTNYVQVFIRDSKLQYIVHQRSCDFVYGFFNDFAWHCFVYRQLINDLYRLEKFKYKVFPDKITYICDSLHIYPRHYEVINSIADKIKSLGVYQ